MRRHIGRSLLTLAVCLAAAPVAPAADHEVAMSGEYVWERSDREIPGEIEARFTPGDADGSWDVVFRFEWEGEMRAWKGEATGSLESGRLEGRAIEDRDRERTFLFSGEVVDGVFSGTHGSERDGGFRSSGRITLRVE